VLLAGDAVDGSIWQIGVRDLGRVEVLNRCTADLEQPRRHPRSEYCDLPYVL